MTETYQNRFDVIASCSNPNSSRSAAGYTFWRNQPLSDGDLQNVISNAKEKLATCPQGCTLDCQLKNMAQSRVDQLKKSFFGESTPLLE